MSVKFNDAEIINNKLLTSNQTKWLKFIKSLPWMSTIKFNYYKMHDTGKLKLIGVVTLSDQKTYTAGETWDAIEEYGESALLIIRDAFKSKALQCAGLKR